MARYIDADELRCRVKTKTNPYGKPTLDYEILTVDYYDFVAFFNMHLTHHSTSD